MRVQRFSPALLIGAAMTLAGCGGSPITVEVVADGPNGPVPQANTEVRFFPFDRDSVFDVLDSQASMPKPQVSEGPRTGSYRVMLSISSNDPMAVKSPRQVACSSTTCIG